MSIENPTLAHFRHFIRRGGFSSLFTNFPSTTVEDSLQIGPFMQNKPNFRKSQMNVNPYNTRDYKNISNWTLGESKPNSNPIKPNLKRAKMNVNSFITKDYRKYDDFSVRINKPNFQKAQNERKLICYRGLQKKDDFAVRKSKPNSNPVLSAVEWANLKIPPLRPALSRA